MINIKKTTDLYPSPLLDKELIPCPDCGAGYVESGPRPGLLMFTAKQYQVKCLVCWAKGKKANTARKAINNWNDGLITSKYSIDNANCAERLKQLRDERGLSQRALAEKANLSKFTIGHIELNKSVPKRETLEKLASALGVSMSALN